MFRRILIAITVAVALFMAPLTSAHADNGYHLIWSSDDPVTGFSAVPVPLGGFSDCNHNAGKATAVCLGLPPELQQIWWAYPAGWPDTATQRNLSVHGYYEPQDTTWISDGVMHVRMFRNATTGFNESAALLPMKAFGLTYGMFTETWSVPQTGAGFKSAHLLWHLGSSTCCEEDFPEADWDGVKIVHAFSHHPGGQSSFSAAVPFDATSHTSTIQWEPGRVTFLLDGKVIGTSTNSIPSTPEKWVLQNESALDSERATLGEAAQMDISYVAVYGYGPAPAPSPTPTPTPTTTACNVVTP